MERDIMSSLFIDGFHGVRGESASEFINPT